MNTYTEIAIEFFKELRVTERREKEVKKKLHDLVLKIPREERGEYIRITEEIDSGSGYRPKKFKPKQSPAFHTLHAIYHERDFRVRINDSTVEKVRQTLVKCVGIETPDLQGCPACSQGYDLVLTSPLVEFCP